MVLVHNWTESFRIGRVVGNWIDKSQLDPAVSTYPVLQLGCDLFRHQRSEAQLSFTCIVKKSIYELADIFTTWIPLLRKVCRFA